MICLYKNKIMEVVDFPNYLIYPDGKVSSKRFLGRYLKQRKNNCGYYYVKLYEDGKSKTHYIHRLVALHYISPENKKEVDHINRDKSDNRIENLRWVDKTENQQNKGKQKNNTTGFKNISYFKERNVYQYRKTIKGKIHWKYFKTLTDALVYKFVFSLLIKSRIISINKC